MLIMNPEIISAISLILTTILWGVYVKFTKDTYKEMRKQTKLNNKTFEEMRKQTELNNNAHLVVNKIICDSLEEDTNDQIPEQAKELYKKWEIIVEKNLDVVGSSKKYLVLELKNRGYSDIINWKLNLNLKIEPSNNLREVAQTTEEKEEILIKSNDNTSYIEEGESIKIAILELGSFPIINYSWDIEFKDMREQKYTNFYKDNSGIHKNAFVHVSEEEIE